MAHERNQCGSMQLCSYAGKRIEDQAEGAGAPSLHSRCGNTGATSSAQSPVHIVCTYLVCTLYSRQAQAWKIAALQSHVKHVR